MTDANDPTSQTPEETAFWRRAEKQSVSAETGGEKAADESRKPEIFLSLHSNGGFFRDRRDMTIRLLADYKSFLERSPKADPREPEKLNNAQGSESIMSDGQSMESKLLWLRGNLCDRHFNLYTMSSGECPACLLLKYGSHLSGCKRLEPSFSSEIKECDCGWSKYESVALAESSLSSPPPEFQEWVVEQEGNERILRRYYQSQHLMKRDVAIFCDWNGPEDVKADEKRVMELLAYANFRQSPSLSESGAESVHSGKQNTADKSELLPTQLPPDK